MADLSDKTAGELRQQKRIIEQLKSNGWVVVDPYTIVADGGVWPDITAMAEAAKREADGQVLMQLTTDKGVSHILVMRDGERVDSSRRLGLNATKETK